MDLRPLCNTGMSVEARCQDFQDTPIKLKPVNARGPSSKSGEEVGSATHTYDADTTSGPPESVCRIRKAPTPSGIDRGNAIRSRGSRGNDRRCALVNDQLASPNVSQDQHATV